ncbi:MAG TPA: alpha/beta hydrolase, partial [Terriglobales bacterium]|nr:alpha/beta hydrolase [Terriglobales bacterium]
TGIAAHAPSRSGTQEINKSKSIDSAANAETFVTAGSLRLHYLDRGSGRPVIMIHGNAGDARDFDFGTLDLVARNYHVIAFDLPGHGFSKMGSRAKGTIQEQAETLHQALSTLGVRDPILVGHSWGGAIALAYALLYPDETCALVLLAPAAYSDGRHDAPLGLLMRLPLLSDACLALFKPIFGRRLLKKSLKDAFSPEPIPDEYLRVVAPVWLDRNHLKAFIKNDAMIDSSLRELSPRYGKILARVVIVTGDSDLAVSPEKNAFELHQVIKNSQLVVIPHAGHQIPQTNPEAVLKAVDMAAARTTLTNDIEKPQQQVAVSKGVANR